MFGAWVKTVGFDAWQQDMVYWNGRINYIEEIKEMWVSVNKMGDGINGIGFVSKE